VHGVVRLPSNVVRFRRSAFLHLVHRFRAIAVFGRRLSRGPALPIAASPDVYRSVSPAQGFAEKHPVSVPSSRAFVRRTLPG
jgi:hypothetical protein